MILMYNSKYLKPYLYTYLKAFQIKVITNIMIMITEFDTTPYQKMLVVCVFQSFMSLNFNNDTITMKMYI